MAPLTATVTSNRIRGNRTITVTTPINNAWTMLIAMKAGKRLDPREKPSISDGLRPARVATA
jgi:hypothetical protein